jgi:hypothetical protein
MVSEGEEDPTRAGQSQHPQAGLKLRSQLAQLLTGALRKRVTAQLRILPFFHRRLTAHQLRKSKRAAAPPRTECFQLQGAERLTHPRCMRRVLSALNDPSAPWVIAGGFFRSARP